MIFKSKTSVARTGPVQAEIDQGNFETDGQKLVTIAQLKNRVF
jgi:hypothetical protein